MEAGPAHDRVLTVPNALSAVRLALIPALVYALLVVHADAWAVAILAISGVSDWADGKIARVLGQASSLGALLDPAVDRLYLVTVPIVFGVRGLVPWWIVITLLARDGLLATTLPVLRRRGLTALPVTYVGKAATFGLMAAFPLILLGHLGGVCNRVLLACGWAALIWGLYMYLWALVLYALQVVAVVRTMPPVTAGDRGWRGHREPGGEQPRAGKGG
ncbi:MAG: CDP-alcohol phosphatidyltransferase family protein [Mycobacterium sp.]|uniref:CDP-alcohol phosphatidyltransferase family protein n=1 Tax=Mycobacterium sp. TaxID=1785 RepID=UPI0026386822|nr:CDP-alcohol phosphatidyltransferase family protein [Mycobacterium sp.]MDI3315792.1 CDP-alcohol phosphatidyltransferase family protein [Mycobacterium sp.]